MKWLIAWGAAIVVGSFLMSRLFSINDDYDRLRESFIREELRKLGLK